MSSLDEAFIRAFSKKSGTERPAASAPAPPSDPAAVAQFEPESILVVPSVVDAPEVAGRLNSLTIDVARRDARDDRLFAVDGPVGRRVPAPHAQGFKPDSNDVEKPALSGRLRPLSRRSEGGSATEGVSRRIDPPSPVLPGPTGVSIGGGRPSSPRAATVANQAAAVSGMAVSHAAVSEAEPIEVTRTESGLRVERFTLPPVCQWLTRSAEPMFQQFAREMVAGMRRGRRVYLVTSCKRGEGRTTLTIALGSMLARQGGKVLLIDADSIRPQLATSLGFEPAGQSASEGEFAGSPDASVVRSSAQPGLAMLPLGEASSSGGEATDWKSSMRAMRERYDLLIVDGPPLTDPRLSRCQPGELAGVIDAALLVRHVEDTSSVELRTAQQHLERAGIAYGGVAENFVLFE